ncbi:MAG TPA: uracil-DNA glycosylase family protein [Candidatus Thermoplasmatota archaeon]|nr:uracil-DNA glycosylase family protein [Candidatus Thermoplasmatota archaeon]
MRLVEAAARLRDALDEVELPGVAHAYHPLRYAWDPHEKYLRAYGDARGRALFVGMNPGPWGMAQTGVPFADVAWAHGWMGIGGHVAPPLRTHPKRPILGFDSTRSDPSGGKFYGWAKRRFGTAKAFFERCFVTNYCPLLLLDAQGRNIPLPSLAKHALARLQPACDAWLEDALDALAPCVLVPMGQFVEAQVRRIAPSAAIHAVRHPSPANPANNAGWGEDLDAIL